MCEKCIFDCKFCPVPKLQGRVKTINEMLAMTEQAQRKVQCAYRRLGLSYEGAQKEASKKFSK